ncbi:hypothetical protein QCA50_008322 [Cerrena zonata]|uniref:Uncharacterized protein n=1 Tax=Cerrena zonata TaxID=2478898 RepID=A0AAW0GFR3_9APHY
MSRAVAAAVISSLPWARKKLPQLDSKSDLPTAPNQSRPLLDTSIPPISSTSTSASSVSPHAYVQQAQTSYGAVTIEPTPVPSRQRFRRSSSSLGRVPEEVLVPGGEVDGNEDGDNGDEEREREREEEVEWELEREGYYRGSYRTKVFLYTFVPLGCLLLFVLLALLPILVWPQRTTSAPHPHVQYFPFPLPELLVSASLWSLVHLIRLPIYTAFSALLYHTSSWSSWIRTILFNLSYAFVYNVLRTAALPILHVRHEMDYPLPTWRDLAFRRVWWVALGWALIETIVGIAQDYAQIGLYKNVMVSEDKFVALEDGGFGEGSTSAEVLPMSPTRMDSSRNPEEQPLLSRVGSSGSNSKLSVTSAASEAEALEMEVESDLEQLLNIKEREELEEIYGLPIIKIPVFVLCLQRIDSILLTVGITLILSGSYLRSSISLTSSALSNPPLSSNKPFFATFPSIVLLNTFFDGHVFPTRLAETRGTHNRVYRFPRWLGYDVCRTRTLGSSCIIISMPCMDKNAWAVFSSIVIRDPSFYLS